MKIAIVSPFYNEERYLRSFLEDISKSPYPIYLVDDGSTDSSLAIAKRFKRKSKRITLLFHRVNLGKGAALKTGCEAAFSDGIEAVIMMDSDTQHSVNDLPKFVKALKQGKKVVLGVRSFGDKFPTERLLGNKFASFLINIFFGAKFKDPLSGYRAFTKDVYKKIMWESRGYEVETEMMIRLAKERIPFEEIEINTLYFDKIKGVSIIEALSILSKIIFWRFMI